MTVSIQNQEFARRPSRQARPGKVMLMAGIPLLAVAVVGFVALRWFSDVPTVPPTAARPASEAAPAVSAGAPATTVDRTAPVPGRAPASDGALPLAPAPAVAEARAPAPAAVPAALPPAPLRTVAGWVQNVRPTWLRAGATNDAQGFTELPAQEPLRVLETRPDWLLVAYAGDGQSRAAGTAWVSAADVSPLERLPSWARPYQATPLWAGADATAAPYTTLPVWSWLELMGFEQQGRLLVRYPGDGGARMPGEAWVDATDLVPTRAPRQQEIPRAYPATTQPGVVRINVPYRSQLDGTPWASANCGPTTLGMALASQGKLVSSTELRRQVLDAQQIWSDDVGSFMEALVQVAGANGVQVVGFMEAGKLKRWSVDDVRAQVQAGRPVIAQVAFQALPGRSKAAYDGDHFVVITGVAGDRFIYNDSIDSDGLGYDRVMTAGELRNAMASATDRKYALAAFAVTRAGS